MRRVMKRPLLVLAVAVVGAAFVVPAAGTPAQAPKRGGTLVFRMLGPEPSCLNILRCGLPPTLFPVVDTVLVKPFEVRPHFTYRPKLATATFTKKRPFTLTYRIHPDARWSDGKPITARDFVFTLRAIRAYGDPPARELHRVVRSIRIVNAKTLRVVLRPRSSVWRELFGNVLPEHALRGEDLTKIWSDAIDNPKTGQPIGSGPFLIERFDPGRQLVFRRNPRYWGPHAPYLDRIVVRFSPTPSDPTDELRNGALDVAAGVPFDLVPALRRQPGIRVSATQSQNFEHLDLQLGPEGHPALRTKLVRRALAYGIDRVALGRQIYGAAKPTMAPLDSAVIVAQSPYYEAGWSSYRYRPTRARALLAQAGCRRGDDGIYSCGGKRLSLRFVTNGGSPTRERALSLAREQLRRAGIEAVPVFASPGAFFTQILPGGTFDAALFAWSFAPGASWSSIYGCGGADNYTGYCQRLVTADLNQAGRILDAERQARVLNRADARMAKDVPVIPFYQQVLTAARTADVRNYVLYPANSFWNAENWWLDR
jgi:peptide/nickel transport system substrate-binding protein